MREAVDLEQAVYGALGERVARHDACAFEQQPNLADRASRVLAFGHENGRLHQWKNRHETAIAKAAEAAKFCGACKKTRCGPTVSRCVSLSVNYVNAQRHLAEGDDGSGKMV
ncbi:hypothetical protein AWB78_08732 [Caballeronia calidae]|uniref:Uncharacterized protein n=1 Tax=Caballeronia calidae TaxID=1777139 RepID=A0A158ELR6_9BURK|nr:hypothetical protein AWB78_08732 [Caballeronia calidae]